MASRNTGDRKQSPASVSRPSLVIPRENPLRQWGYLLTVVGTAVVGLGSIFLALALVWHPGGGGTRQRRQRTDEEPEAATGG